MDADTLDDRSTWTELRELLEQGDSAALIQWIDALPPGEMARTLSRLTDDERSQIMEIVGPEEAAELLNQVSEAQAVDIIEELDAKSAAAIVEELDSDEQADILAELDDQDAEAILQEMDPEEASDARKLISYDWSTAGGVMITEYLSFTSNTTTSQVLDNLRANKETYADYDVQYIYITSEQGYLKGVLKLRDLLLAKDDRRVGSLMLKDPDRVKTSEPVNALRELFEEHNYLGIPVVDDEDKLVGVVRRAAVEEAVGEMATEDFLKLSGLSGEEELRTMPLWERTWRRLSWLLVGLLLSVTAASVIAAYEHILQEVIVLAAFLPVVANLSGASGNQAVAVSIRELTLGIVKPWEVIRVVFQEMLVGLLIGLCLGIVLGTIVGFWKGEMNWHLGLVVGGAMFANGLISVVIGGSVPLMLKQMRLDPALASGPLVMTIADACGFFITLMLASLMLPYIN